MLDNADIASDLRGSEDKRIATDRLLVEVISEGPHCVPCEYAVAAVRYVAEDYQGRIDVRIVETKRKKDASRYLYLCRNYGGLLPVPSVLIEGGVVFEAIPEPEALRRALDEAFLTRETKP